jgi:hypothetical protein
MSYYATSESLPPQKFFFILETLRRANFCSSLVALQHCNYYTARRTHSARFRARKLGLTIDIDKAKNCPQNAVSVIPLPILEVDIPVVALPRPLPIPHPGQWNTIAADGTVSSIQVPRAPLMPCVSLPQTSSDMDMDLPCSAFSSDEEEDGEYSDDDMAISQSPSASLPSLFLGSNPTRVSSVSGLPTPPDSALQATKYMSGNHQPKIMWRIMHSPKLAIHSYIDGRMSQCL